MPNVSELNNSPLKTLVRVLSPADRINLLQDVVKVGSQKAIDVCLHKLIQSFPSLSKPKRRRTKSIEQQVQALVASWDYHMPDGEEIVVNLFQEGVFLHVNCDKLKPIKEWVVRRLYEDGTILRTIPREKDPFFSKRYYRVYEIINNGTQKFPICYS